MACHRLDFNWDYFLCSKNIFNSGDTEALSNGVYIIRLITPDKIYFKKLIKE